MSRFEHKLPAVLEPIGDICVEITIPAHPDYVALFVRAVRMLETNRLYERDEFLSAKIVVDQWRQRTITPLIEALASGTGMCGVDGECLAYPPFAGFISYTPQNPYTQPDFVPDGYELPPFYVNGKDSSHDLPNYNKGDIIVNFGAINLEVGLELENAPQIVLCLEGSGVVELKLLSIAQGGVVVLTVDNPPDIFDILAGIISDDLLIVDLNQDIISLPPETATEIIQELTIETEGEHSVYITFLPILDDSLIPLRFGGGLRAVDLCGNIRPCGTPAPEPPPPLEGVTELKPEFQFTADCGMEYRLRDQEDNIVQDWQIVPGWTDNAAACFGAFMSIDYEALKAAIKEGNYEAWNDLAKQVVSGRTTDFNVGSDGTVSDPTTGDPTPELPEEDPETPIDDTLAAKAGGAIFLVDKLQKILNDMHTWFASGTITQQQAEDRLVNLYEFEQAKANVFSLYWYGVYTNSSGAVTLAESTLEGLFFCKGVSLPTLARYIYENHATALEVPVLEVFQENLNQSQLSAWFTEGSATPATDYETYACTKIDTEIITMDMSTGDIVSKTTVGVWKRGHRMLIKISGTYADSDQPDLLGDGMYDIDTVTGVKIFNSIGFNSSGTANPVQAKVPYEPSHVYAFTIDKSAAGSDAVNQFQKNNGAMANPNVTGTLTIEITDLGEYTI
jgi:hypothetical protein